MNGKKHKKAMRKQVCLCFCKLVDEFLCAGCGCAAEPCQRAERTCAEAATLRQLRRPRSTRPWFACFALRQLTSLIDHMPVFLVRVTVSGVPPGGLDVEDVAPASKTQPLASATGTGMNKVKAKAQACEEVLRLVREMFYSVASA